MTGPASRPLLVAPVAGFAAWLVAPTLDARLEVAARQGVPAELLAQARATFAAVKAAGDEWVRWKAAADSVAEVGEMAEAADAVMPRGSSHEEWISTEAAALMLGVTPRRVRQLLADGALDGGRDGRRRLVSRRSAEALRDLRSAS